MSSSKATDYVYADRMYSDCVSTYKAKLIIKSKESSRVRTIVEKRGLTFMTYPGWQIDAKRLIFGVCKHKVSAIENAIEKL